MPGVFIAKSLSRSTIATAAALLSLALAAGPAAAVPPNTPVISEPPVDGRIVHGEDVHMETGPFSDLDVGNTHLCSDFEIWTVTAGGALVDRVWFASCVAGIEKIHIRLGDGAFQGPYLGRTTLLPNISFKLRARHRDSSGDAVNEWSAYSERAFSTAVAISAVPLQVNDASATPAPSLTDTVGAPLNLPTGATPGTLRLETPTGVLILEIRGLNGTSNQITSPAPLAANQSVRIRAIAGTAAYNQPAANLSFTDGTGAPRTIFLPAFNLAPAATAVYWTSSNGSTFTGAIGQTAPVFTTLARGAPVPWTTRAQGYAVDIFATGLRLPVNIAFVSNPGPNATDPYFYVAELYGSIKLVRRNGAVSTYASNLLNYTPTGIFPGSGEQGLVGLAVEPATGDLLASLVYDAAPPGGPHSPRVVRFHSIDGGQTSATQTTVLDMPGETMGASHQISNVTFGPDGKLYVHVGDGYDISQGQNTATFRGKILRLNPDGTAPADNPLYNAVGGISATDYIFGFGYASPFGGAWRATDNAHYTAEQGPTVDRLTKLVRGRNYLYDGTDASLASFALYNWNPSSVPTNLTFIQSQTFGGSGFPATLYGRAFVTEAGATWATGPQTIGKRIAYTLIDGSGTGAGSPVSFVEYNGSGKASVSAIAAGPDGLYFSDMYRDLGAATPTDTGANVLRVRFVGDAGFTAAPTISDTAPLIVQFNDASLVPGGATAWLWNFGDGTSSTLRNPSHVYSAAGFYTVRLTVTGTAGPVSTQRERLIRIGQIPRVAMIGGSLPPSTADLAAADYLISLGYEVISLDDETVNRPNAAQLANDYGLVIISSSVGSGNVAGEFRQTNLPMIFWEALLLQNAREALADATTTLGSQTQIAITNNTHPVTQGLALGNLAAYTVAQTHNLASGNIAAGALTLATRVGGTNPAILVADTGAALLAGYVAPARRVFLFYNDTSFTATNPAGKSILSNSVCWTMSLTPTITTQPAGTVVPPGQTATFTVASTGHPQRTYQWRKGGVNVVNGGRISGATSPTLSITNLQASDAGAYDVVISTTACGSVTSTPATLTVGTPCRADFNNSGTVTVQDIFDFLAAYFAGSPAADFNSSGTVTVQDIFDFLAAYFAGCA